jgi:protein SCO1
VSTTVLPFTRIWSVLLVATVFLVGCSKEPAPLPVLPVGGEFSLVGDDRSPFSLSSLRGKVVLVFFGYSSCPDACPTTLSKLAAVSRRLGEDRARVKTLYISVDPDRDTPEVLRADLQHFDLDVLGLTGSKGAIDKVVALFGAAYEITPSPGSAAKYSVAHTTWLYALDTHGRTRIRFPYEAKVDDIVGGIRALLADGV